MTDLEKAARECSIEMAMWIAECGSNEAKELWDNYVDARRAVDAERVGGSANGPIETFLPSAVRAAEKAMQKYPQPNYVISKWAEETGEVTKDLIHLAEGRTSFDHLRGEIVQALAMLHRLIVEGDQVHGLRPLADMMEA